MTHRVRTSLLSIVLVVSQLLAAMPAFAQSDEQRAAARELATDGADAFDAGRYQDAIDRFTRAESIVHATPHLLFLARSYAKLKQYVKAREAYIKIINEPLRANATKGVKDAKTSAQDEIESVEVKIGRLTIDVQGKEQAHDVVVQVNGTPIPAALVGAPQPIDPGSHRVEAIATGFRAAPQTVAIGEGERKEIVLRLESDPSAVPPGAAAPPAAAAAPPPAAATSAAPAAPKDEGASDGSSGLRIGSYVAFGVGAVGLGLGTYFVLDMSKKRSEADDLCTLPGGKCDPAVRDDVNDLDAQANSAGTKSIVGFVAGGIGVVTGITLLAIAGGSSNDEAANAPARPYVAPFIGRDTIGVKGAF